MNDGSERGSCGRGEVADRVTLGWAMSRMEPTSYVLIETRDLLLIIELRLWIGCSSRQHVSYVLVCAVSHESRFGGFDAELVPSRSKYPAL